MDFFEAVHTQRAIRRFRDEPVPEALLRQVLDAAIRAPSGSNLQPWRWIVVRDSATRARLSASLRETVEASGFLASVRERMANAESERDRRMYEAGIALASEVGEAPVLVVPCLIGLSSPTTDQGSLLAGSSIYGAVQNLLLSARALGLGTVMTTYHARFEEGLRAILGIPDEATPVALIPLGWPAEGQRFGRAARKPVEEVAFADRWGAPFSAA
jgi:nitroreductase